MAIAGIILCCLNFLLVIVLIIIGIAGAGFDSVSRHAYRL